MSDWVPVHADSTVVPTFRTSNGRLRRRLLLGSFALTEIPLSRLRGIVLDMALSAPHPAAFELRSGPQTRPRDKAADRLFLRATGDGWSLLNSADEVLFRGFGLAGRRQCLEFAREIRVLVVYT